jgi:membrane protease YdiL (CAAX protease family)
MSLLLGYTNAAYQANYMMLQTFAAGAGIVAIYRYYQQDKQYHTVFSQRLTHTFLAIQRKDKVINPVLMFVCGALLGIGLNNIIGATGVAQYSDNYQKVTAQFFAGGMLFEILGAGILVPIVEELLYRGVVYARASDWIGQKRAVVVSAIIFGALHFNLVQFIYAFVMGVILTLFLERAGHLYGAIAGHMGANLITILRNETDFLGWTKENLFLYWGVTSVMMLVGGMIIWRLLRR